MNARDRMTAYNGDEIVSLNEAMDMVKLDWQVAETLDAKLLPISTTIFAIVTI